MTGMSRYYISRALMSIALGVFLAVTGSQWWLAGLASMIVLAFFLWAPHSGRYAVHPEFGITALRRDERTQGINDKAARNAYVVSMLFIAGITIYFGTIASASVPIAILKFALILGLLVYYGSDFWLRRKQ
jgi:uncharacterized membrane protein